MRKKQTYRREISNMFGTAGVFSEQQVFPILIL